jgi:hypothetical protein
MGVRSRPWETVAGVVVDLQGRSRPLLGSGASGPSWGALPFSSVVNLLNGTMVVSARWWLRWRQEKRWREDKDGMGHCPLALL